MGSEVISFDSHNLFLCFIITAGFQYTGFINAYVAQFDKITDLWGASNFVILQLVLLFHYGTFSLRAVVVAAIVSIWGIRLSGYLFYRVLKMGHDERFDGARSFVPFFIFWTFQIAWVWIVSLPPRPHCRDRSLACRQPQQGKHLGHLVRGGRLGGRSFWRLSRVHRRPPEERIQKQPQQQRQVLRCGRLVSLSPPKLPG